MKMKTGLPKPPGVGKINSGFSGQSLELYLPSFPAIEHPGEQGLCLLYSGFQQRNDHGPYAYML